MTTSRILHGSAHILDLPAASVHMIATSPPYWGLRRYAGDQEVDWPEVTYSPMPGLPALTVPPMRCGLGAESTPEAYIGHLILCLREWRRVMRGDGTCWVNLGDSYAQQSLRHRNGQNGTVPIRGSNLIDNTRSTVASGLKPKDLCLIPARFALAAQADGWYVRSDIIWAKCLSGGTRVYAKTQKGEMPMTIKDLVRLDPSTVKLWTGEKWSDVISFSETPRPDAPLELTLRSGERIGCTANHVWFTQRGLIRADQIIPGDIIETCKLPESKQPRCPELLPNEIGHFIGLYIAEGSQSDGTIQIAGHSDDKMRWDWLSNFVARYDGHLSRHNTSGKACSININSPVILGIVNAYVSGHDSHDKHIHPRCWARENGFLQSVLRGYLDGDGHFENGRWRLAFCDNDNLAADLRTICARLGLSLRLRRTKHTCNGKSFPGWRGDIRVTRRGHDSEVITIGRSRARKFWDISIADKPHLFALASGILTHNSNPMPESVTDRCTKAHEYIYMLAASERYYYDAEAVKEQSDTPNKFNGSAGHKSGGWRQKRWGEIWYRGKRLPQPSQRLDRRHDSVPGRTLRSMARSPGRADDPGRHQRTGRLPGMRGTVEEGGGADRYRRH